MTTKTLLFLICYGGLVAPAVAQITITEADIRSRLSNKITTTTYGADSFDGLATIAHQTGDNRTFDFRSAAFDDGFGYTIELITCTDDLPGCTEPDFATANFIAREVFSGPQTDSVAVSFARLDPDGFYILGGAGRDMSSGLGDVVIKFSPALLSEKLPLTMGTNWNTSALLISPEFEGFEITVEDTYLVDAWGTLLTPHGNAEALKVSNRSVQRFSILGQVFADTTYFVHFFTKSYFGASIELDAMGQVIGADYTVVSDPGVGREDEVELPQRITLDQNYPNPFNPATTIPFTLQASGPVTLAVFDMLGREVAVLAHGVRPAGTYAVSWEPVDVPSGVYLYRLEAAGTTVTRYLTLLK